jgi:hypothetical protein
MLLVLYGVAFAIGGEWITPWAKRLFLAARKDSRRDGKIGILLFYLLAYGALYYAYVIEETRGPDALLPPAWR